MRYLSPGAWDVRTALEPDVHHRGFLVVAGLLSREVNVRPATVQVSLNSPTPDKMHDLIGVAVRYRDIRQGRARHDLQVALDRHPRRVEPDLCDQAGNGRSRDHSPGLAIDLDVEGVGIGHIG